MLQTSSNSMKDKSSNNHNSQLMKNSTCNNKIMGSQLVTNKKNSIKNGIREEEGIYFNYSLGDIKYRTSKGTDQIFTRNNQDSAVSLSLDSTANQFNPNKKYNPNSKL